MDERILRLMLTIVCVLSKGKNKTYDKSHVSRLKNMVLGHIKQPHEFICLDNSPFPGWWAKLSLFEPGRFNGRVLYFDLDVTITGNLDDLAEYPGQFVICRDWGRFGFNSSVMCWDAGTADNIYTDFLPVSENIMSRFQGDQDWITIKKTDADKFPRDWCYSYKLGLKTGFPEDMRVCVHHGFPKPWEIN